MKRAKHTRYNPEKRAWRGRSYKAVGRRVREMRERLVEDDEDLAPVVEQQTRQS